MEVWPAVDEVHHSNVKYLYPKAARSNITPALPLSKKHLKKDKGRRCHHSCEIVLVPMWPGLDTLCIEAIHKYFLPVRNNLWGRMCVYLHMNDPHPSFHSSLCYFPQCGSEERKSKGENKHVLFLILYRLSSLGPSERLNHKRVHSLGDILFPPSLNTRYHKPDPENSSSSCI